MTADHQMQPDDHLGDHEHIKWPRNRGVYGGFPMKNGDSPGFMVVITHEKMGGFSMVFLKQRVEF